MSDSPKAVRNRRPLQKPVFILQPFDAANPEHMKGNITITLNKALALELTRFIKESELGENEGHIYAMQGHIGRWFKQRSDEIKKQKETKTEEVRPEGQN